MKKWVPIIAGSFCALGTGEGIAQNIQAGSRITITSDWHEANGGPYSPLIVSCNANSGMCLRDTRVDPANSPMIRTDYGLQVSFADWGITYLFRSGGEGLFFDANGNQTGNFFWKQ